ncbi:hypothetical protein SR41_04055 [Sphingomonas melonis]|uniref:Ribonuclease VapC n=1 Tax=Sphingomonas melonis TaxID=152682 RepID=A0A0D1MQ90_9SPHN|nr:type II toxin-antitoxin system VapC family toxin [Sphingomonas melonis]KIU29521.1 hypothetical protein SR41_04055 [Sphingomonas melonis]
MTLIVDTSVALKWVVAEDGSDRAATFLGGDLVAPELLLSELGNALWKKVRQGEIGALHATAAFAEIEAWLPIVTTLPASARGLEIALTLDHPVYDCLYLALAEMTGWKVLTADRRLIANCRDTAFAALLASLDDADPPDV